MKLHFSQRYAARPLTEADVDAILALCAENEQFYRYHPPLATKESILEDLTACRRGRTRRTSTISASSMRKGLLPCWISLSVIRRKMAPTSAFS